MREAVMAALPADAAVLVAAVADWRVEPSSGKLRKSAGPPQLEWKPTPDILAELAASPARPPLVVGFAAETEDVIASGKAKQRAKGCDWIVANDVSDGVMGGEHNRVHLVTGDGIESWDEAPKEVVAQRLVERIARHLTDRP
jgi:phosphopantothenoylcysteine decarboxylase/phosphopantothenate--cysteine ligase